MPNIPNSREKEQLHPFEIIEQICKKSDNEEEALNKICKELHISRADAYLYSDKYFKNRWTDS